MGSEEDKISYVIVVDGTELDARRLFGQRFPNFHGGARPDTLVPYMCAPCALGEIGAGLEWVTKALANSYSSITVTIVISTTRTWSNFHIPQELVDLTHRFKSNLKVSFSSPAQRAASA